VGKADGHHRMPALRRAPVSSRRRRIGAATQSNQSEKGTPVMTPRTLRKIHGLASGRVVAFTELPHQRKIARCPRAFCFPRSQHFAPMMPDPRSRRLATPGFPPPSRCRSRRLHRRRPAQAALAGKVDGKCRRHLLPHRAGPRLANLTAQGPRGPWTYPPLDRDTCSAYAVKSCSPRPRSRSAR
jgi:hypothetical protein